MSNIVQLCCLYTKHKTQKRKVWKDGKLVLRKASNQVMLYDANPALGSGGSMLDQVELTKTQMTDIAQMNETDVETEQFLITVEGPWVDAVQAKQPSSKPKLNGNALARSKVFTGIQKVLSSKFRKPSAYIPPPPGQKKRKLLQRPPPLQPGELEKRHYGNYSQGNSHLPYHQEQSNCHERPRIQRNQMLQEQHPQSLQNPQQQYPNSHHSRGLEGNTQSQQTPTYLKNRNYGNTQKRTYVSSGFVNDDPRYQSQSLYGEENDSGSDCSSGTESESDTRDEQHKNAPSNFNLTQDRPYKPSSYQYDNHHPPNNSTTNAINDPNKQIYNTETNDPPNKIKTVNPSNQANKEHIFNPYTKLNLAAYKHPMGSPHTQVASTDDVKHAMQRQQKQHTLQRQYPIPDNSSNPPLTSTDAFNNMKDTNENNNNNNNSTLSKTDLLAMFQAKPNHPSTMNNTFSEKKSTTRPFLNTSEGSTMQQQKTQSNLCPTKNTNPLMARFGAALNSKSISEGSTMQQPKTQSSICPTTNTNLNPNPDPLMARFGATSNSKSVHDSSATHSNSRIGNNSEETKNLEPSQFQLDLTSSSEDESSEGSSSGEEDEECDDESEGGDCN